MGGSHRHLFDDGDDNDGEEDEKKETVVYMYLANINPDERDDYRATCRT